MPSSPHLTRHWWQQINMKNRAVAADMVDLVILSSSDSSPDRKCENEMTKICFLIERGHQPRPRRGESLPVPYSHWCRSHNAAQHQATDNGGKASLPARSSWSWLGGPPVRLVTQVTVLVSQWRGHRDRPGPLHGQMPWTCQCQDHHGRRGRNVGARPQAAASARPGPRAEPEPSAGPLSHLVAEWKLRFGHRHASDSEHSEFLVQVGCRLGRIGISS